MSYCTDVTASNLVVVVVLTDLCDAMHNLRGYSGLCRQINTALRIMWCLVILISFCIQFQGMEGLIR